MCERARNVDSSFITAVLDRLGQINHGANTFSSAQFSNSIVDVVQCESVGDELVNFQLLLQIHVDQLWHAVNAFPSTECSAYELKTRRIEGI